MATQSMVLQSERWLDEVLLSFTSAAAIGGAAANTEYFRLPSDLGDVSIMEIWVRWLTLATPMTDAIVASAGASLRIVIGTGAVDIVGVQPLRKIAAADIGVYFSPDPLVLWRQGELLELYYPEVDTNASPTAVYVIQAKCVRVRPLESAGLPLQLVR